MKYIALAFVLICSLVTVSLAGTSKSVTFSRGCDGSVTKDVHVEKTRCDGSVLKVDVKVNRPGFCSGRCAGRRVSKSVTLVQPECDG